MCKTENYLIIKKSLLYEVIISLQQKVYTLMSYSMRSSMQVDVCILSVLSMCLIIHVHAVLNLCFFLNEKNERWKFFFLHKTSSLATGFSSTPIAPHNQNTVGQRRCIWKLYTSNLKHLLSVWCGWKYTKIQQDILLDIIIALIPDEHGYLKCIIFLVAIYKQSVKRGPIDLNFKKIENINGTRPY